MHFLYGKLTLSLYFYLIDALFLHKERASD